MTEKDLEDYFSKLGYAVDREVDSGGSQFLVFKSYRIVSGSLAGRECDIALQNFGGLPYVLPPAIHTLPALVPMDMSGPLKTQISSLGPEWQYWSRTRAEAQTPPSVVAHINTIFSEV